MRTVAHWIMNPDLITFTIASRSASRSDGCHFVCIGSFLWLAARYCEKISTTGT